MFCMPGEVAGASDLTARTRGVRSGVAGTSPAVIDPEIDRLVRAERTSLAAIARREGLGPEDALECVQDALCTFLSMDRPSPEHVRASIRVMVRNAARNARRRHHRLRVHGPPDDLIAPGADAEALLAGAEDVARLRACVARLRGPQRDAILLRILDERPGEDVAAELGLARAHVDVLVHRAKAALRACMEEAR
jgi:RNA polymerase sigma-70 factor (ECF subfamily)